MPVEGDMTQGCPDREDPTGKRYEAERCATRHTLRKSFLAWAIITQDATIFLALSAVDLGLWDSWALGDVMRCCQQFIAFEGVEN